MAPLGGLARSWYCISHALAPFYHWHRVAVKDRAQNTARRLYYSITMCKALAVSQLDLFELTEEERLAWLLAVGQHDTSSQAEGEAPAARANAL